MGLISEMMISDANKEYTGANLTAKVCQDLVLMAISRSSLNKNVTIKGGVVMRGITNNARRATQDMDIDFIRYSLSDESIDAFINKLNTIDGITFKRIGKISELSQQDYHGKRVFIEVSDSDGNTLQSKIDLGVHNHLDISQEEFCFDIEQYDEGVSLLINSKEQIFTEKLRSLLKFGAASTRFKDVFDMYYLKDLVSIEVLNSYVQKYILDDAGMKENTFPDIVSRIERTFNNSRYKQRLRGSDKNWLELDTNEVINGLLNFLKEISL